MKIVMMTNTYAPHVGGVARSVEAFTRIYRERGHAVLVVAPVFPDSPKREEGVVRIPAIQKFNGSDFSVVLPIPGILESALDRFDPDVIHSHHPFLMGSAALRAASARNCPLVFTHHTMYEQYTHYVPGDSPALKRFVVQLSTSYANLCDRVFAPSESVAEVLRGRGVRTPVDVVPTGVVLEQFRNGDGKAFRRLHGIPGEAFVIGHLGRLAPEKNLGFLAHSVARVLERRPGAHFLVVGSGPSEPEIREVFVRRGLQHRLHLPGKLVLPDLADAYHAMDLFAFASLSETQGMVLAEAMAAGLPVVAVDAPGAREVVKDGVNGCLLPQPHEANFARAVERVMALRGEARRVWRTAIDETAQAYSLTRCADKALRIYQALDAGEQDAADEDLWHTSARRIRTEWELLRGVARAAGAAANLSPGE